MGVLVPLWAAATLFLSVSAHGQGVAREALRSFPPDTQEFSYSNLAELRSLPNYPQIRQRLFTTQLRGFEEFLRSVGTDPEKDVDEVALGWRGERAETTALFGLATGRFEPTRAHEFFTQQQLPSREYAGFELYAFGSGQDPADLFFAFFSSSSAAFGRLGDLKTIIDVHAGTATALDSNADFVAWEAELEGASLQWGIASGKAAANQAEPWLGGKLPIDPAVLAQHFQAVLYHLEWDNGISTKLTILCQNAEGARALGQVLSLWRDARAARDSPPSLATFLQGLDIQATGSRVELSGRAPLEFLDQILQYH
jgi:hypothetical protein